MTVIVSESGMMSRRSRVCAWTDYFRNPQKRGATVENVNAHANANASAYLTGGP